ncbi:MAG TPA: pilin [Candidatus Paceibacterota bacterium]
MGHPTRFDYIFGYDGVLYSIINGLIVLVAGLALLYFIWGVVVFISKSGESEGRKEGRSKMIWGIVGLFVMVSVWGLVNLIADSFQIGTGSVEQPPQFK